MTGTVGVEVIHDEVMRVIKNKQVHPDVRLTLASIVFADEEGVARLNKGQLAAWLAPPEGRRATADFTKYRIRVLINAGVLAPGSTPTELRSMIAYGQEEEK